MNNVYLIGMMGSGKSATGGELSRLLSGAFVDLDRVIETQEGRTIREIFSVKGESYFRDVERKLLADISARSGQTVATGGGVILDTANCDAMKRTGCVLYLKARFETLWGRVQKSKRRPLLATGDPKQSLADLLKNRASLYEGAADETFETDSKTPKQVAMEIYKKQFAKK